MAHPRRAARDPLKGATRAARQSRFRRVLSFGHALRKPSYFANRFLVSASATQNATTV
jgi:hypothetical protein